MNFWNKFLDLFSSKKIIKVYAPFDGELVPQKKIPDAGFSETALGVGIGIKPTSNKVLSPISGSLAVLFEPSKHCYIISHEKTDLTVFLHLGIDTVNISPEKETFVTNLKQGDSLKELDHLCDMNLQIIKEEATSDITPVLLQNIDFEKVKIVFHKEEGTVKAGELLFSVTL